MSGDEELGASAVGVGCEAVRRWGDYVVTG